MAFPALPQSFDDIDVTKWESFAPYFELLAEVTLSEKNAEEWLENWSNIARFLSEAFSKIYVEKSIDTTDENKEAAFMAMLENVVPPAQVAEQRLKEKLLASGYNLPGMEIPMMHMQDQADLFREENIPLQTQEEKLGNEYEKMTGGLKTEWEGEEKNVSQLDVFLEDKDRTVREKAWRTKMGLWAGIRPDLNELYTKMLPLRHQIALNAGCADYREYSFRRLGRFDYTPQDCLDFHEAIESVVVPAAGRILARRKKALGVERLRPWDLDVETSGGDPLRPYEGQAELEQYGQSIFDQVDPELASYFRTMVDEDLLDLDTRSGKALGGYCMNYPWQRKAFIFMNGKGTQDDVRTLLHECGHAFHAFEGEKQPLIWQVSPVMEFCEVASMAMELLSTPYWERSRGGFYNEEQAARARIQHLEGWILFWPYMAVVDGFQHWVYTHIDEAQDPAKLDEVWDGLWLKFMGGEDWTGLEEVRKSGWHRKGHIFSVPFYYVEYGIAQVGAMQVWRNSLENHAEALASYRRALALGGTASLPDLFAAAGAELRFDKDMLAELVGLGEETIASLR
ncbi:MAG TPA: M3 family oligoendopeptidase [Anaerolineae bacterium]|nr:M3 family oligoendopeptidase [Anaerolineae bacterium]